MKAVIILPVYNEVKNLKIVLPGLIALKEGRELPLSVILVDDGSQDDTVVFATTVAQYYPWLQVVHHQQNQGLGGALATGFREALTIAGKDDAIITMDVNNTMGLFTIPTLTQALQSGADLVVASRYTPGAKVTGVPLFRRVVSRGGSLFCRLTFRVPGLKDYTSGYRAYRAAVLRAALEQWRENFITGRTFECQMEVLLKTLPYIRKVKEVPINLNYNSQKGKSHFQFRRTVKSHFHQFHWFFKHSDIVRKRLPTTLSSSVTKEGQ